MKKLVFLTLAVSLIWAESVARSSLVEAFGGKGGNSADGAVRFEKSADDNNLSRFELYNAQLKEYEESFSRLVNQRRGEYVQRLRSSGFLSE
ncbi:MAG: hypothetical protein LBE89_02590 [Helicobacteraceae bacterium]|jgi:hypothetical protein|nr:hypothetical protein [Helicobacteraceae bacterium]